MQQVDDTALAPIHPGEILKEEFLLELGMSQVELAGHLNVPVPRVNAIILGKRRITADTALRLSRFFGNSTQFWLNLQNHYDLEIARLGIGASLEQIQPLSHREQPVMDRTDRLP